MAKQNSQDVNNKAGSASSSETKTDVNNDSASSAEESSNQSGEKARTLADALEPVVGGPGAPDGQVDLEETSSSETEQDENQEETSGGENEETTADGEADESQDGEESAEGDESEGEESQADDQEESQDGEEAEDANLPFGKHPRWKQMVAERNELREKVAQAEAAKPLADQHQSVVNYCQEYGISPQQFQEGLQLLALINTNPEEAAKRLKPIMQNLGEFDGSSLPSDLEQKVADGKLELEDAQEIARLRARTKHGQNAAKKSEEQLQRERMSNIDRANGDALAMWERTTMKSDPDFRPKKSAESVDGLYELTADKFGALCRATPPRNPQEVTKLLSQAYKSVKQAFATRLAPKKVLKRPLPTTASRNGSSRGEPKSLEEAIASIT